MVNFTLDRSRAMERTARLELNAEAVIGDYRIVFDELTASTMSSVLKGRIIPQSDEAMERFNPRTAEGSMEIPHLEYDLVSDEGKVMRFSGGQSASGGNITFDGKGDALPEDFKTLQIKNIRIETAKLVDKVVVVNADTKGMQVSEDMTINSVYRDGQEICVSISSRGIPVIGLFTQEQQLEEINVEEFELEAKSVEPVERVFRFKASVEGEEDASTGSIDNTSSEESEGDTVAEAIGNGTDSLELHVKFIRYTDISPDTIDIPVD